MVLKALRADPAARYQDAAALGAELRRLRLQHYPRADDAALCAGGLKGRTFSKVRLLSPHHAGWRRKSRVNGNSALAASPVLGVITAMRPGVWPMRKNLAKRRLSAS